MKRVAVGDARSTTEPATRDALVPKHEVSRVPAQTLGAIATLRQKNEKVPPIRIEAVALHASEESVDAETMSVDSATR